MVQTDTILLFLPLTIVILPKYLPCMGNITTSQTLCILTISPAKSAGKHFFFYSKYVLCMYTTISVSKQNHAFLIKPAVWIKPRSNRTPSRCVHVKRQVRLKRDKLNGKDWQCFLWQISSCSTACTESQINNAGISN